VFGKEGFVDIPEDDKKLEGTLPDPELNPMLNPTLGKNLGRWAHVYYTSPPEKREQAVQELLRELESAPKRNGENHRARRAPQARKEDPKDLLVETAEEIGLCPACLHKSSPDQRYCGYCGFSLEGGVAAPAPAELPAPVRPSVGSVRITPVPDAERADDNWQWLHDKNLAELANAQESRGPWKYVFLALILIGLPIGYAVWRSPESSSTKPVPSISKPAAPVTPPAAAPAPSQAKKSPPVAQPSAPAETESQAPASDSDKDEAGANKASGGEKTAATTAPAETADDSATDGADTASPAAPVAASKVVEEGGPELVQGRRLLYGQGVPPDHAAAARWLWRAVAKKNVEAVILLSDLYVRGDGVPQSCDQARLLLTAGVKKGSTAAAEKLHSVLNRCP